MKLKYRFYFILTGLVFGIYGVEQLHRGILSYSNGTFRQTIFSGGTIAMGAFCLILALLPNRNPLRKRSAEKLLEPHSAHRPVYRSGKD